MKLTPEQQRVVDTSGNILVIASAGTGKTHTLISKLNNELENNANHKTAAAITFTRKAARELRSRIDGLPSGCFVGTTNSFIMSEVIPFLYDITRSETSKNIRINYKLKCKSLEEIYHELIDNGKIGVLDCRGTIVRKNALFYIASFIVKNSKACRLYLASKYFMIFVDEYQDCDSDMHKFFLELSQDLGISLVAMGDDKQFIYGWRGAYKESFNELKHMADFTTIYLSKNFRSHQAIQNYSNILYPDQFQNLYQPASCNNIVLICSTYNPNPLCAISHIIDCTLKTAVLRWSNEKARACAKEFAAHVGECVYLKTPPISEVDSETSWLHYELAKYFILPKNSVYNLIYECPLDIADNVLIPRLKEVLPPPTAFPCTKEDFRKIYDKVFDIFGYEVNDDDFDALYLTIKDESYYPIFKQHEYSNITATIHTAKGLEFEQVILFAEDFDLRNTEVLALHYVAVTRAMKRLIIINNGYSQVFMQELRRIIERAGLNHSSVVDCRSV